jgi:hypothetical protein
MVVAGGVLVATGVGGPVGMMLISAGADTIIQKATTGEVNWGQVAVSGAFGAVGGGAGALIGKHLLGNAAEGAVENVANYAVSGQPVTPGGLLRNAAEGAATSAATGGTMSKVHLPTAVHRLSDVAPLPPTGLGERAQRIADKVLEDPNKMGHIFDKKEHGLDPLVDSMGGKRPVIEAVAHHLDKKDLPPGKFVEDVPISDATVRVRGSNVEDTPRVGTMFIPRDTP